MSFSSSADEESSVDSELVAKRLSPSADSFVLGAFDGTGVLVGLTGVFREMQAKHSHKAFMWGVYVAPEFRGRSLGKQLVTAAIGQASQLPGVELLCTSVFLSAPRARMLYLNCGFTSWGVQPRSAKLTGAYLAEEHLLLELSASVRNAT